VRPPAQSTGPLAKERLQSGHTCFGRCGAGLGDLPGPCFRQAGSGFGQATLCLFVVASQVSTGNRIPKNASLARAPPAVCSPSVWLHSDSVPASAVDAG